MNATALQNAYRPLAKVELDRNAKIVTITHTPFETMETTALNLQVQKDKLDEAKAAFLDLSYTVIDDRLARAEALIGEADALLAQGDTARAYVCSLNASDLLASARRFDVRVARGGKSGGLVIVRPKKATRRSKRPSSASPQ